MPVMSRSPEQLEATIVSASRKPIKFSQTVRVLLLPSGFLQSVTTFVSCLMKTGLMFSGLVLPAAHLYASGPGAKLLVHPCQSQAPARGRVVDSSAGTLLLG